MGSLSLLQGIFPTQELNWHTCAQSCLTLCDPMNCSPPGSSIHGIFQARILEWVAISYSRGSSPPRDRTHVSCSSCVSRRMLYHCATWEAPIELGSPALQADSLPVGLPGKPKKHLFGVNFINMALCSTSYEIKDEKYIVLIFRAQHRAKPGK